MTIVVTWRTDTQLPFPKRRPHTHPSKQAPAPSKPPQTDAPNQPAHHPRYPPGAKLRLLVSECMPVSHGKELKMRCPSTREKAATNQRLERLQRAKNHIQSVVRDTRHAEMQCVRLAWHLLFGLEVALDRCGMGVNPHAHHHFCVDDAVTKRTER